MMTAPRRTLQFRFCLLVAMIFVLGLGNSSWAVVYHSGKYTIDIEVRNSIQLIIPDAKVDIWVGSKNISVDARAAGYLTKSISIPLTQATYYKRIVNLSDPARTFSAEDWSGGPLSSVYFRCDQYGIPSNKYGITVSIPEAMWPKPILKNVRLYDPNWGTTFKYEGSIEQSDGFYHVRMIISRRLFGITGKHWVILFDTRKPTGEATQQPRAEIIGRWLTRLDTCERLLGDQLPEEAEPLAESLFTHLDQSTVQALDIPIPESLAYHYSTADRFQELHRDIR